MQNMKNHKWKIILVLLAIVWAGCLCVVNAYASDIKAVCAADMAQFSGVTVSPDQNAWTTDYKNQNIIQMPTGYEVYTGVASTCPTLQPGEHFYRAEATGAVPVLRWEVQWSNAQCIHSFDAQNYHGFETESGICERYYHSGWFAYCAACEEPITEMYVYASLDTVKGITSMPAQSDYLYICPFCNGLEQGASYTHLCKKVSYNHYVVKYDANAPTGVTAKGTMADTKHMYNNAELYEGSLASEKGYGDKKLRKNNYVCEGYVFAGWSQKRDGLGELYEDEAEVLNLCEKEDDAITLYAQWVPAKSTLIIDANGGTYLGEETYFVTGDYGTVYELKEQNLSLPNGFLVYFETNGGSTISPIATKSVFAFWEAWGELQGVLEDGIYTFMGEEGSVDTLKACYAGGILILPDSQKDNELLVGWYLDEALSQEGFLGKPGEEVFIEEATTLYAKWSALSLWSKDNYVAYNGVGAVDLDWQQKDAEKLFYKVYQSENCLDWVPLADADTSGEDISLKLQFDTTTQLEEVVIPWTGYYKLSAFGGEGADYQGVPGEKGGSVEAEYWLETGDVIWAYSGEIGQSDTSTKVYLLRDEEKHLLLTAGGGSSGDSIGTKTTLLNPAMEDVAFRSNITNMFPSGTGVYVVFNSQSEYPTLKISGEDWAEATGNLAIGGLNRTLETLRLEYIEDAYGHVQAWGESIQALAKENEPAFWGARQSAGGFSRTFVGTYPTNGNTNLVVSGAIESWSGNVDGHIRFRILDAETEEVLYDVTKVSGFSDWSGNVLVSKVLTWEDFDVSGVEEVTVEVYIKQVSGEGAATKVILYDTYFYGKTIYETVVTPAEPNYINTAFGCKNWESMTGANDGNGYAILESEDVGYLDEFSLSDVYAPDEMAPERILDGRVLKISEKEAVIEIATPRDRGSTYHHKVESFRIADGYIEPVSISNVTQNTLTSNVAGYYYYLSGESQGDANKSHTYVEKNEWTIAVSGWDEFLYVAPVDKAGNLGETTCFYLSDFEEDIFELEAVIYKLDETLEEVFKKGESGILKIDAGEYMDRIEVLFPEEWVEYHPDFNVTMTYDGTQMYEQRLLSFFVPMESSNGLYEIEVVAYKGDKKLVCKPTLIVAEGSVLDGLHTRIRNNG